MNRTWYDWKKTKDGNIDLNIRRQMAWCSWTEDEEWCGVPEREARTADLPLFAISYWDKWQGLPEKKTKDGGLAAATGAHQRTTAAGRNMERHILHQTKVKTENHENTRSIPRQRQDCKIWKDTCWTHQNVMWWQPGWTSLFYAEGSWP